MQVLEPAIARPSGRADEFFRLARVPKGSKDGDIKM
jgi:hypothetical protein